MSERGFFSASNDIKTLNGNIFSGFPWLTTHLIVKLSSLASHHILYHNNHDDDITYIAVYVLHTIS